MAKSSAECLFHLKGTGIDETEAKKILDDIKDIDDAKVKERVKRQEVILAINDAVGMSRRQEHTDLVFDNFWQEVTKDVTSMSKLFKNIYKKFVGRDSIDTKRRILKNKLNVKLREYEALFGCEIGLTEMAQDSDLEREVFLKTHDIDFIDIKKLRGDKKVYNAQKMLPENATEADRIAYTIKAYNEYTRQLSIKHGVDVTYHKNYVVHRKYDDKVLDSMTESEWANFMAERLDVKETFGHEMSKANLLQKLRNTYGKIKENNSLRGLQGEKEFDGKPKFKRRREYVFKNSQAAYEVFDTMTVSGLASQIQDSTWSIAGEAARISSIGYDSKKFETMLVGAIAKFAGKPGIKPSKFKFADSLLNTKVLQALHDITGENSYVPTGFSTLSTTVKVAVATTKLGNSITVAMLDFLDAGRQVFYTNGDMLSGLIEWNTNMINTVRTNGVLNTLRGDTEKLMDVGRELGLTLHYISSDASMRVARGELATGVDPFSRNIEKYSATAMKWATLLPQQTGLSKISTGVVGANTFNKLVNKAKKNNFDITKLNAFEIDTLKEYKLSAVDLEIISMGRQFSPWGNTEFISPRGVREILSTGDHEKTIKKLAEKLGIDEDKVPTRVVDISLKYESYLNDFITRGTPTPELQAKTALFKGSKSEPVNIMMGLITQFMDTPVAQLGAYNEMYDKLKRVYASEDAELKDVLRYVSVPLATQVGMQMVAGIGLYLAYDAVWSALLGKDENKFQKLANASDQERRMILLDAAGRTSAVPFLFEAVNNATSPYYNQNVFDTISAPSFDIAQDFANVMKPDGPTFMNQMKRHSPNAWFIQAYNNYSE